jgi:hypothetical protein
MRRGLLTNGASVCGLHLLQHWQHWRAAALQVRDAHQHVRIAAERAHIRVIAAAALGPEDKQTQEWQGRQAATETQRLTTSQVGMPLLRSLKVTKGLLAATRLV